MRAKLEAARQELSGERRQVAVLFADLSGFTAMAEHMDPEEVSLLMNRVLQRLSEAVYRYEGYVDKFIGDAVMALFGAPLAHEDDPERAVLAGFAMLDAVAEQNAAGGPKLALRVGINLGDVIAAHMGSGLRLQYTVMGDAVNLASRLESHAAPNTVLVSESLYRRIAARFRAEELAPFEVKGRSEPVRAYRILERHVGPGFLSRRVTPFVGRESELATVQGFLERLARGERHVLAVEGEPGSGKTRLVREALAVSPPGELTIEVGFSGVRLPGQRSIAANIFHQVAPEEPPGHGALERAAGLLGAEAEEHRAGLAGLAAEADPSSGLAATGEGDPAVARLNRWAALVALLRRAAELRPVLLLVEDVHWIDESSQELLELLVAGLLGRPFGMIVTGRAPLQETALLEGADRVSLRPLARPAAEALLRDLLEHVDPTARRDLLHRSAGNPLFLQELAHLAREAGERGLEPGSIPDTLQALLVSRMDRLSSPIRRLLQMASVLGTRFPARLLQGLYELEAQEVPFGRALRTLEEESFLELEMNGEELRRFHHALIQEVAYAGLLVRIRRVLHESVARLGETYYAGRAEAEAAFFAHHYWEAGLRADAAPHLWTAGRRAAEDYDLAAAERALDRLATILEYDADLLPEPQERARFAEVHGGVLLHRGKLDAAEVRFRTLEGLGHEHARSDWIARGMEHRGRIAWYRGQLDQARELFESGLAASAAAEDRLTADLHNDLGIVFYYRGDAERSLAEHAQARELRERLGDTLGLAKSYSNVGNVLLHLRDDLSRAEEHYRTALELARRVGDRQMTSSVQNNLAGVAQDRGRCEEALELLAQSSRIQEEMGWLFLSFLTLRNRASCEISLGRVGEALRHLRLLVEKGDSLLEPVNRVNVRLFLCDTWLRVLADHEAAAALEEGRRLAREFDVDVLVDELHLREGRLLAARGDWAAAALAFGRAEVEATRLEHLDAALLAGAHGRRARAHAGQPIEKPGARPASGRPTLTTLVRYLHADALAVRSASRDVASSLEEAAAAAEDVGEVCLARAAFERGAEVWDLFGEDAAAHHARDRARAMLQRLEEQIPPELRGAFVAHPRNVRLRGSSGS
ncbi:MAG: adenylate/guanylate cyclase domain-containing protein [Gemmatimonadota bacterium]